MSRPSRVTIKIKSLEKQLFIANIVDQEFRENMLTSPATFWASLAERLEEDTGVYLTPNLMKQALYMGLYGASAHLIANTLNERLEFQEENYSDEDVLEVKNWICNFSNSPYLSAQRNRVVSSLTVSRRFNREIFDRYNDIVAGLSFSTDEISMDVWAFTESTLERFSNTMLSILESVCEDLNMGSIRGLFTTEYFIGDRAV